MLIIKIIAGLLSTACLLSLSYYVVAFITKSRIMLYGLHSPSKPQIALALFALFGFLFCIYSGVSNMLFWMPSSWGNYDEDGEWKTLSSAIAFVCAFLSLMLIAPILQAADNIIVQKYIDLRNSERLNILKASHSQATLEWQISKYLECKEQNLEKLENIRLHIPVRKMQRRDASEPFEIFDLVQENYTYRDLEDLAKTQLKDYLSNKAKIKSSLGVLNG